MVEQYIPQPDDSILGIITPKEPFVFQPTIVEPTPEQVSEALNQVKPTTVEENFDIEKLLRTKIRSSSNHAFFIVDLGVLRQQVERWRSLMPRVEMFYAIKCNPNPVMLKVLVSMGVNFDCASMSEIKTVMRLGVTPDRIIFANPCKLASHIAFARTARVKMTTFDNEDELRKIKRIFPAARLVLRIATDDSAAAHSRLSVKFGARESEWANLIKVAKDLKLRLIGVSFHVGSGCSDAKAYELALRASRKVFDMAAEAGFKMELLDIGGGFPGTDTGVPTFQQIADVVNPTLASLFPENIRVIAEPGRYVAMRTHTLAVTIHGRRITPEQRIYYVDDGVYGSLSCIVWDHQKPTPIPLARNAHERPHHPSTIFGPTCDSIDCIGKDLNLPEMQIGEWFYFRDMGAYTAASACQFNGFLTERFFYVDSKQSASATGRGKRPATPLKDMIKQQPKVPKTQKPVVPPTARPPPQ